MLQDIFPHVYHNEYKPREPKAGDYVLVFGKNTVLIGGTDEALILPTFPQISVKIDDFLFTIDDKAYYGLWDDMTLEGFEMKSIRAVFRSFPKEIPFACATGFHLCSWKRYHKFCGVCGTALVPSDIERALVCPSCKHTIYPDIHPAVNIAIRNGNKILLARNARAVNANYALIAGFIEIGETAEDTVRREVMEEVGLKVKNIHYYGSQPWGTVQNLQIGFYCDLDGSDAIHMDQSEIAEAKWFERSEVPDSSGNPSITGALIEAFRHGEI